MGRRRKKKRNFTTTTTPTGPTCALCRATRLTPRVFESDYCWIADCMSCRVPMVVFKWHETKIHSSWVGSMLRELWIVAAERYGDEGFVIDIERNSIPNHWHAHARPNNRGAIYEYSSTITWVTVEESPPPAEEPPSPAEEPPADECESTAVDDAPPAEWWETRDNRRLVQEVLQRWRDEPR